MAGDNAAQIAEWNGRLGEHWAVEQEQLDAIIRPFGEAALKAAAAQPGDMVIDIGCGCGDTVIDLAQSVGPSGRVLGLDVSAPMLDVARRRSERFANVAFQLGDASQAPLPAGQDLLFSRYGVMFFDDPVAAFRHLGAALKPGGRTAFVCWQGLARNPWSIVPAVAARKGAGLTAPPADPHAPGPFAFADPDRVKGILSNAGFVDIGIAPFETGIPLGRTVREATLQSLKLGPASRIARDAPDKRLAIEAAIEEALGPLAAADGTVTLPGLAWVVTARKPN
jgi:SAM-dependent methyltransferase